MTFINRYTYEISDDLLHSHDAVATTTSSSLVKLKTITLNDLYPDPSTLRIKFDMKSSSIVADVQGRIYKNGAAVGTLRDMGSTTYATYSEDLSFAKGDTLELWGREDYVGSATCSVRNFRVYGVIHHISRGFIGVDSTP